jgi:precorrin-8X/cobalt-precorrin-8 methylmutase
MTHYIVDPIRIETESFQQIKTLVDLTRFSPDEQQIVMRIVHTCGLPNIAEQILFSENAVAAGLSAIKNQANIICDVNMLMCSLTKRLLQQEPQCFINKASVISQAKTHGKTRCMMAVDAWKSHIEHSIILIGNAPTALFRLLEVLKAGYKKPALVIAMPVGFIGAAESKAQLWQEYQQLGIECITLAGTQGGSAITASAMNALLRMEQGIYF